MQDLYIGTDSSGQPFTLPASIINHTMAILAKKRTGKSYLLGVIAEEFLKAGLPFVVLDPVGVTWGLRSSPDGKKPSPFPIVIFGGEHGDIPIERNMGEAVAQAIVEENFSCVIDLTLLSKNAWREFVRDFCHELFTINRTPRHVFLEEAPEFIPQHLRPDMAPTYEAVERLVRLGGNRGLGCTLVSQRPAITSKDVLEQIDTLLALRTVGPRDRKAVLDMFQGVLEEEQLPLLDEFKRGIAKLPNGQAWIWSPEKLQTFAQIKIRDRLTFHPDPERQIAVKVVEARPDVSALRARFATPEQEVEEGKQPRRQDGTIRALTSRAERAESLAASRLESLELQKEIVAEQHQTIEELRTKLNGVESLRSGLVTILSDSVNPVTTLGPALEVDREEIIREIMARLPSDSKGGVQLVAPDALRKSFESKAVDRILQSMDELTDRQRQMLLWLDSHVSVTLHTLARELAGVTYWNGPVSKPWEEDKQVLIKKGLIGQSQKWLRSRLKEEIAEQLSNHPGADVDGVYNHVLHRLSSQLVKGV